MFAEEVQVWLSPFTSASLPSCLASPNLSHPCQKELSSLNGSAVNSPLRLPSLQGCP